MSSKKNSDNSHDSHDSLEGSDSAELKISVIIGISDSPQELRFECEYTPESLTELAKVAFAQQGVLELRDIKGSTFLIPASKISYLQLGDGMEKKVGFTAL
jgi:hypothetical protein